MPLFSLGKRPADLGLQDGKLRTCPGSPNCVSSDAGSVEPIRVADGESGTWDAVVAAVEKLPRTRIISRTDDYVHAESRTLILGFVDDLELHFRPAEKLVAVRSASRLGYSDFGVNRRRVEQLRRAVAASS